MSLKRVMLVILTFSFFLQIAVRPCNGWERQRVIKVQQNQGEQREIEGKAFALLDQVIEDSKTLRLAENRALVQASAAYILWTRDEKRARALLKDALNNFDEIMGSVKSGDISIETFGDLREEILEMVAQRDGMLALELLQVTRPFSVKAPGTSHQWADEQQLELSIASLISATDPKEAVRIAEKSLKKDVYAQIPDLIVSLQLTDSEAAAKLAGILVKKLDTQKLATNEEAAGAALSLLRISTKPTAIASEPVNTPAHVDPPILDQQSLRTLTQALASAAVARSTNNDTLLLALQPSLFEVEMYAPTYAPIVKRRLSQLMKTRNSGQDGLSTSSLPEDESLNNETTISGAKRGDTEQPRESPLLLGTPEERVAMLCELAAASQNDKKQSLEILEKALNLIQKHAQNFAQLKAQLQVARGFIPLAPERSFEIIEPMIDQLNSLADPMVVGFLTEEQLVRNDELLLKPLFESIDMLLGGDAKDLCLLASAEFDRTRELAGNFQRNELKIMARFLIVKSLLTKGSTEGSRMFLRGSGLGR